MSVFFCPFSYHSISLPILFPSFKIDSDIFEDFFGDFGGRSGRRGRKENFRGSDLRYDLSIALEEAYNGKKQDIKFSTSEKCNICSGSGSKPGHNAESCSMCGGHEIGRAHVWTPVT